MFEESFYTKKSTAGYAELPLLRYLHGTIKLGNKNIRTGHGGFQQKRMGCISSHLIIGGIFMRQKLAFVGVDQFTSHYLCISQPV